MFSSYPNTWYLHLQCPFHSCVEFRPDIRACHKLITTISLKATECSTKAYVVKVTSWSASSTSLPLDLVSRRRALGGDGGGCKQTKAPMLQSTYNWTLLLHSVKTL